MVSDLSAVAGTLVRYEYVPWSFGDSVAFEALRAYGTQRDPGVEDFVHGFLRAWAARAEPFRRLDCTVPGLALVETYESTGDDLLLTAALRLAEYLSVRPRIRGIFATWEHSPLRRPWGGAPLSATDARLLAKPPAGSFVDCLHFDPPFFAALGRSSGDRRWTDLAVEQAGAYIEALQRDSGFFDHFVLEGVEGTFGPGWGRGQGWAALGLLDVLAALGPEHPARPELTRSLVRLLLAMSRTQRSDGHWNAVVDRASEVETSTAAFMAVAARRALRGPAELDAETRTRLADMTLRAHEAVVAALSAEGRLLGVSAAVNASTVDGHYEHAPTGFVVPWGQGPALLCLLENVEQ